MWGVPPWTFGQKVTLVYSGNLSPRPRGSLKVSVPHAGTVPYVAGYWVLLHGPRLVLRRLACVPAMPMPGWATSSLLSVVVGGGEGGREALLSRERKPATGTGQQKWVFVDASSTSVARQV